MAQSGLLLFTNLSMSAKLKEGHRKMTKQIALTYGEGKLDFEFPDGFMMGDLIRSNASQNRSTPEQMSQKIDETLGDPVGRPRLREMVKGKSVGLVISDEFRSGLQELIAYRMMSEIFAGDPAGLDVFIATGTHDQGVYAKNLIPAVYKSAGALGKNVRVLPNDCDGGEHLYIGQTELGTPAEVWKEWLKTEVRVYGHEAKHHYMNGYSVVDKQVCPGVSSRRCIASTHKHALAHELSAAGRSPHHPVESRRNNPFAQDNRSVRLLSERRLLVNGELKEVDPLPTFLLDMISTTTSIDWIMSGDPETVSRHMTTAVDDFAAHVLPRTKYVVISPGGPPACNALYGVQNCFDTALKFAIENGGEALIVAPCLGRPDLSEEVAGLAPDGKSKALFWDNLVKWLPRSLEDWGKWVDENFELYLWKTDRMLKLQRQQKVKLYLYSELSDEKVTPGGFIPAPDPNAWIAERAARGDGKALVIDEGNKLLVLPN
jgi:nickel-dependent lactate racemase